MEKKILIVEDEHKLRRIIKDFLEHENYKVIEASDGEEGVDLFFSEKPDLIILDLMLPKLNGFEVLKEVREFNKDLPVIMLTAQGSEADILKGYELRVDEYILKPVSLKVLVAKVKAFLRSKNDTEEIIYKDIRINVEKMQVYIEDILVELSAREFELILYFIKNKGQVLSRDKIITTLWGYDYDGDLRAVDSQIKRLRKKLNGRYISTIRGVGYKLEEA